MVCKRKRGRCALFFYAKRQEGITKPWKCLLTGKRGGEGKQNSESEKKKGNRRNLKRERRCFAEPKREVCSKTEKPNSGENSNREIEAANMAAGGRERQNIKGETGGGKPIQTWNIGDRNCERMRTGKRFGKFLIKRRGNSIAGYKKNLKAERNKYVPFYGCV